MFYLWMEVGRHAFSPTPECSSFIISLYIFLIVCRLLVLAEHGTYWQPTFRSSFYLMCKVKLDSGPKYRLGFSFTIQIPTWIYVLTFNMGWERNFIYLLKSLVDLNLDKVSLVWMSPLLVERFILVWRTLHRHALQPSYKIYLLYWTK